MEELTDKLGFIETFILFSPTLPVSSLLFCFTVLRDSQCTKSAVLQISMRCHLG